MEYWDVFVVIVAVVGLFATVIPFFAKLNRTLGELNATVAQLQKVVQNLETNNKQTHSEIFRKLNDHETRISHLEK